MSCQKKEVYRKGQCPLHRAWIHEDGTHWPLITTETLDAWEHCYTHTQAVDISVFSCFSGTLLANKYIMMLMAQILETTIS